MSISLCQKVFSMPYCKDSVPFKYKSNINYSKINKYQYKISNRICKTFKETKSELL